MLEFSKATRIETTPSKFINENTYVEMETTTINNNEELPALLAIINAPKKCEPNKREDVHGRCREVQ